MKSFFKGILFVIVLQIMAGSYTFAENIIWVDGASTKGCTVVLPANVNLNLPTNDTYELGYFIYLTNTYSCVGTKIITPGTDVVIDLGISEGDGSIYGYSPGDRFISFIRNTSDLSEIYAVEFSYENGKNKCEFGGTSTISGVKVSMWNWPAITKTSYCNTDNSFIIAFPYGWAIPNLNFSNGTSYVDNGDNSFTIIPGGMQPGNYKLAFTMVTALANDTTFNFQINSCGENSIVINPSQKDELTFADKESIEVFDINLKKVSSIAAPTVWAGTDNEGKPLPMGLYILVHADKSVQYVTVVY